MTESVRYHSKIGHRSTFPLGLAPLGDRRSNRCKKKLLGGHLAIEIQVIEIRLASADFLIKSSVLSDLNLSNSKKNYFIHISSIKLFYSNLSFMNN